MPVTGEKSDLAELLTGRGEDPRVEYKSWFDLSGAAARAKLAKHIAAIANHGRGYIVFGVDDETRLPVASPAPDPTQYRQDAIAGIMQSFLEPQVHVRVETVAVGGIDYPVAIVPPHGEMPVVVKRDGHPDSGLRRGDVFIRNAGPRSERIAASSDWARLIDRCVGARADVMGSILRQAMASSAGPRPGVAALLRAAMLATEADFAAQVGELVGLVDAKSRGYIDLAGSAHATLG